MKTGKNSISSLTEKGQVVKSSSMSKSHGFRKPNMSAPGHSRHFDGLPMTSGLPPEADIVTAGRHVSKVPTTAVGPLMVLS
jgi:hypothetical protein